MKITKYGHACIVLEEQGKRLVIDPGVFTESFGDASNVVAVVVTHVHPDHFDPAHLKTIFTLNPDATLFSTPDVASAAIDGNIVTAEDGLEIDAGPFHLKFAGKMHAVIHQDMPQPFNIGVFINDAFFYPGDSFTTIDEPVKILAVPANAPWANVSESMDYIRVIKPEQCIPTHNGLLSGFGHQIYNGALEKATKDIGSIFTYLQPGESLDISS